MKKVFFTIVLLLILTLKTPAGQSQMTFAEAFSNVGQTPMLVLVYADWADNYLKCLDEFRVLEDEYGNTFNFVEMNIAAESTKAFNARFKIDQNLPYILMFRDGGKISRYLDNKCLLDDSCVRSRIKTFIH